MEQVRCLILDLDGTVYLGDQLIPGALRLRQAAQDLGIDVFFLTNNSSRSRSYYAAKLTRMGWPVTPDGVLSSSQATATTLKSRGYQRLYVVGTESLTDELTAYGLVVCGEEEEQVDCVVVGFDTSLVYGKLRAAGRHLQKGTPMI